MLLFFNSIFFFCVLQLRVLSHMDSYRALVSFQSCAIDVTLSTPIGSLQFMFRIFSNCQNTKKYYSHVEKEGLLNNFTLELNVIISLFLENNNQ